MAVKKPLVIGSKGELEQLQSGDTVDTGITNNQSITVTNANASAITIGMPVYISSAGNVDKAKADSGSTAYVIGLVEEATIAAAGTGKVLTDGILISADWTAVTGSATLTSGAIYFLDATTAGKLTTTATTTTGEYLVRVGIAINTTTLEVSLSRAIKL